LSVTWSSRCWIILGWILTWAAVESTCSSACSTPPHSPEASGGPYSPCHSSPQPSSEWTRPSSYGGSARTCRHRQPCRQAGPGAGRPLRTGPPRRVRGRADLGSRASRASGMSGSGGSIRRCQHKGTGRS
jgi:hypothetical protein